VTEVLVEGELELATVEVLGALAYGQLRSFEAAARAVRYAPDAVAADRLAELAVREHRAYVALRDHLTERTDLAAAVMDRQKPHFDDYFDRVPLDDWFAAGVFFAVGLPVAADFGRALAPALAPETGVVVVGALADRAPFEQFAREHLERLLVDDAARERARHIAADVLGRALTAFQGVTADTDALKVLLAHHAEEAGVSGETRVKDMAITVLSGHRRRLIALGLEDLEEL
jgi:hypothetical protein